jgi:hypothetical protein
MDPSAASSFLRFFVGFTLLISLSFGLTIAVQTYAGAQDAARQQAAAAAQMLKH